jgi:hypothetical protein
MPTTQNTEADNEIPRRVSLPRSRPGTETNPEYALVPQLTSATPATGVHAGSNVSSAIVGKGFQPGCVVKVNGVAQATTYTSPTALTATVSMAGTVAGTVPLVVTAQNGLSSDPVNFVIT